MKDFYMIFAEKIDKIAKKIIEILSMLFALIIVLAAAFINVTRENAYSDEFTFTRDNILFNVVFFLAVVFLMFIFVKWISKDIDKRRRILLIVEMVLALIIGLGFSAFSKCFPTADQASVYYGSKHFASNFFGDLAEVGSYFSVYPHQMALALAQELILRVCHTESYHVLQGVNALCNALTIWSIYSITDDFFEDKKISVYAILLNFFCIPFHWYTPFVYGDLASIAFSLFGFALLIKAICKEKNRKNITAFQLIGSGISIVVATLVRSNTLVFVIAIILCSIVYVIKEKKPRLLIYIAIVGVICATINQTCIRFYEMRSGQEINDGMPSICHVVMGLQEGPMGNGYYNGYNFDTYVNKANYNKELAYSIANSDLNSRIEEFKSDKSYAFNFFKNKFLTQWLSFDFDCYHFTCGAYYDRWPVVESLFSGKLFSVTSFYMDKYGFFMYSLIFAGIIILFKNKKYGIMYYVLPTAFIGGALFYLVWEAAGRYVLPYFIYLIPIAAMGIDYFDGLINVMMGKSRKNKA